MSEYYGPSKSKSSRDLKQETKSKRRNKHHQEYRHTKMESRTPPLPPKRTSIEELIKKRESLKMELQKISKQTDTNYKSSKSRNDEQSASNPTELHSRKRHLKILEDSNVIKRKQSIKESSPEHNGDYTQVESEDEETIIEKRRQQRKQLLEKFTISNKEDPGKDESKAEKYKLKNAPAVQIKPVKPETTDMFAEIDDNDRRSKPDCVTQDNAENNPQLTDNWDDSDGYYNIRVGDEINNNRYTIKSILGQGVFANVVRAQDNSQGNIDVAIKIVRNNDLMYKTSSKEIAVLKEINKADPEHKNHCVKLLRHFMHKGHLCLVLEPLHMDLRCILKKYGRNHGINMKALISYSRQLLVALRLLKKIGIVHADIKPDNILVNEKKNVLKLCDFGSAAKVDDHEPTPYLVSRFYRAPEIILGIPYRHSIDIWSTACTMYEIATGKIMFTGVSNNKMLKCFMDLKGKMPARLIKKGKFKDQHFNYNNNFLLHKQDEFSGRDKVVEISNIIITRDLQKELKKYCKNLTTNEEKKLTQLKDVLDKMLMLDLNQRLSVTDCLRHPFIQEELKK